MRSMKLLSIIFSLFISVFFSFFIFPENVRGKWVCDSYSDSNCDSSCPASPTSTWCWDNDATSSCQTYRWDFPEPGGCEDSRTSCTECTDHWTCAGDILRHFTGGCSGGACSYTDKDCNDFNNDWLDTNPLDTQWVDDVECKEKQQKKQVRYDWTCPTSFCNPGSVTHERWVDRGFTRNKDDGISCSSLTCPSDFCGASACTGSGNYFCDYSSSISRTCQLGVCSPGSCSVTNQGNCNDKDGWYCLDANKIENRDYSCGPPCTYTDPPDVDCTTETTTDTDGGNEPLTQGTVSDRISCSGSPGSAGCTVKEYTDSCNGNTLTEYYPNGADYSSTTYTCQCSDGKCIPCPGPVSVSLDKSTVLPNEVVTASSSVPSCSTGRTIVYQMDLVSPCCSAVSSYQCTSTGSSGCDWNFNAQASEGTYDVRIKMDHNFDGDTNDANEVSSAVSLTVSSCTSTPPSRTVQIGNECQVVISPYARDETDFNAGKESSGRWNAGKTTVGPTYITTEFDDAPSGSCDLDLKFTNWGLGKDEYPGKPSWFGASVKKDAKNAGNDLSYGYEATTSGSCKFLTLETVCGEVCPIGLGTQTVSILVPDTNLGIGHEFRVGECKDNADCSLPKPFCDTSTNLCASKEPNLVSPVNGATTDRTPDLDWAPVIDAQTYRWYVDDNAGGPSPVDTGCFFGTGATTITLSLNTQYYWSVKACTDNSCATCGSYATERTFTVGKCDVNDVDTNGDEEGDRSNQCPASGGKLGRCDLTAGPTQYTCQYPSCVSNSECATNYCCVDDPSGPKTGTGTCVSRGTRSVDNKLLCN